MIKTVTAIEEFVRHRRLAIVGASNDPRKYGHAVYHNLKDKGFDVVAVNPRLSEVGGDPCHASLKALPPGVEGAVLIVPPPATEQVVRDAVDAGIVRVWMQPGAESDEAIDYCETHGVSVVHHACIMTQT